MLRRQQLRNMSLGSKNTSQSQFSILRLNVL
nr:MAG TPA: hypothetical protein [Bacteriophage sp.]